MPSADATPTGPLPAPAGPGSSPTPAPPPYAGRSHDELAELARELLLAGHLIDRSGMPHLIGRFGREGMASVAIDEWMAASPIYTRRMQRLLGFEGDRVETIFKGMQLDVGAPPEFMDFRYVVHGDTSGEFWLDHCGALMDVEPMGDEYVRAMCHDIEDPTFDATAAATNPRARVRPIHRPPRVPADRAPHCAWTVTIDPDADPLPFPAQAELLSRSRAATLPLAGPSAVLPTDDGWNDYAGPLDQDLVMERFSSAALSAILDEVSLQGHLLSRGFLVHVAELADAGEALAIGGKQLSGIAGVTTKRLATLLGVAPDLAGIAAVLAVHPMFLPRAYVDLRLDRTGERADEVLHVAIGACPATDEDDGMTWPAILATVDDAGLRSAVQCLAPHARVRRVETLPGTVAAWQVRLDPDAEPVHQPDEVTLTEFSTGVGFRFERRR
ncbi:MAG: hypothetical protein JWO68_1002 [Actinomycetia bacterium]|nr:hypothetical protein [Actinomycetes bacterium]